MTILIVILIVDISSLFIFVLNVYHMLNVHFHVYLQSMGQGACAGYQKQKKTKKECGVTSTKQISSDADDISEKTDRHYTNNNNNSYQIKV